VNSNLFGDSPVSLAIERLRQYEPEEGYYLAFSGGKDSVCIKQLAIDAGVAFDAHYSLTTIDPPELVRFIRAHHPDVHIERPARPFLSRLREKGFPTRRSRWCCAEYKELHGHGRLVVTGVRAAESTRRAKRGITEMASDGRKDMLNPIIDWSDSDVWDFIRERNLPYCSLYDEGFSRVGCLFCPNAKPIHRQMAAIRYPRYRERFRRAFVALYDNRKAAGVSSVDRWESGDAMFRWWISDVSLPSKDDEQLCLDMGRPLGGWQG